MPEEARMHRRELLQTAAADTASVVLGSRPAGAAQQDAAKRRPRGRPGDLRTKTPPAPRA